MKPAWDKLMDSFKDSKTAVVGDVDCTKPDNEALCEKQKVEGYPTIKWGKIGALKDYDGEREFSDLLNFAKKNLGPVCGPTDLKECDETQRKQLEEAMKLKDPELQAKIKVQDDEVDKLEKEFEAKLKEIEEQQNKMEKVKNEKVEAIMKAGLGSLKAVWDHRHPPPPPPPPSEEDMGDEEGDGDGPEDDKDDMGEDEAPEEAGKKDDL